MAFMINDNCTKCGDCIAECAFEAISEVDGNIVIDADLCEDCEACVEICKKDAIEEA